MPYKLGLFLSPGGRGFSSVTMLTIVVLVLMIKQSTAVNFAVMMTLEGPGYWNPPPDAKVNVRTSPINIQTAKAKYDPQLKPLRIAANDAPVLMENNGYTIRFAGDHIDEIQISGGPLKATYKMLEKHLLVSDMGRGSGSEHTVDGKAFCMEIRSVCYKGDSFADAVQHPDGIFILSAFFKEGKTENVALKEVVSKLKNIENNGSETRIGIAEDKVKLDYGKYYTYQGTITVAPYFKAIWVILSDYIEISSKQLQAFRNVKLPMQPHKMPLVPLGKRVVRRSFKTASEMDNSATACLPPWGSCCGCQWSWPCSLLLSLLPGG